MSKKDKTVTEIAYQGAFYTIVFVLFTKFLTVFSQLALGMYLDVQQFGFFATVTGLLSLTSWLQDTGIQKLLIQKRNEELDELIPPVMMVTLFCSVLSILGLISLSLLHKNFEEIKWLVIITCFSIPFLSMANIYKAILSRELKFKIIAKLSSINALIYNLVLVLFAFYMRNAIVFSLSLLVSNFYLMLAFRHYVTLSSRVRFFSGDIFKYLSDIKWVMIGTLFASIAMRGDYLVLSSVLSSVQVGYYFFGFMFVGNIFLIVNQAVQGVMFPSFSKINTDTQQVKEIFNKASSLILYTTSLGALLAMTLSEAIFALLWKGKWDSALIVVFYISMSFPLRSLTLLSFAYLESIGRWRAKAFILAVDAFTLVISCYAGALYNGIEGASLFVCTQRAISGFIIHIYSYYILNFRLSNEIFLVIKRLLPLFVCYLVFQSEILYRLVVWDAELNGFTVCLLLSLLLTMIYFLLSSVFNKDASKFAFRRLLILKRKLLSI